MSVSELEQRLTPLTLSQSVWQPWGPTGRYPMEDDSDDDEIISGSNMRRALSWSGYTSYMLHSNFADNAAPTEGFGQSERMDQSGGPEDVVRQEEDGYSSSSESLDASDGRIIDDGQTWVCTDMLEDPDRQTASAWRALSAVQMWFQEASADFDSSELMLEQDAWEYQFMSESTDSTHFSEAGMAQYLSECTEVGHCSSEEHTALNGAGRVAHSKSSSSYAIETPSEMPPSPGAAGSKDTPGATRRQGKRRAKKSCKARPEKSAESVTTLMVHNLPYALTREELLDGIHRSGYSDLYNFCHLPRTFRTGKNQGFAFINFVSPEAAQRFTKDWHGNRSYLGLSNSCRPIRIKTANMQGIEECEKIAQSSKMRKVKTGTFKPLIIRRASDAPSAPGA